MFRFLIAAAALLGATGALANGDAPCALEKPCAVTDGEYALTFPPGWDGETPLKAMVFFHGHNSSMKNTIRSGGLRESFVDRGWLLIAPQGERTGDAPRRWPARPGADWRDDVAFTLAVLDDVAARVPLDGPPVAAGFSAGGSMAWMLGCYEGARFSAIVSVAGALRRPTPDICEGMTPRALHIHGFGDAQVPLEGRGIRDWHQGDVHETLSLFRRSRGCRSNPDAIEVGKTWRSRVWRTCEGGGLAYVEHDGGHGLPRGWAEIAFEWLESGAVAAE